MHAVLVRCAGLDLLQWFVAFGSVDLARPRTTAGRGLTTFRLGTDSDRFARISLDLDKATGFRCGGFYRWRCSFCRFHCNFFRRLGCRRFHRLCHWLFGHCRRCGYFGRTRGDRLRCNGLHELRCGLVHGLFCLRCFGG